MIWFGGDEDGYVFSNSNGDAAVAGGGGRVGDDDGVFIFSRLTEIPQYKDAH